MKKIMYSFLVLVMLFAACDSEKTAEKMAEDAIEKQTGNEAEINLEEGKVEIKTKDGKAEINTKEGKSEIKTKDGKAEFSTGNSAELPENFPEDIFICDDAKIKSSAAAQGSFAVNYVSEMNADDMLDKYLSEMKDDDWKLIGETNQTDQRTRAFEKNDRRTGITIKEKGNNTKVEILTGKK
jgi:hypothetical protein